MSHVEDLRQAIEHLKDLNLNVQLALNEQHERVQEILQLGAEIMSASNNPLVTDMNAAVNAIFQRLEECLAHTESFENKATQYQQQL